MYLSTPDPAMGRYSTLPDPFVAELRTIPGFLELTTGYTLCAECERCERSVVYLSPRERQAARALDLRLYGTGAATRINRQGCRCPFYDQPSYGCRIYPDRPLICNLFPLDILENESDGRYWWVAFGACEELARGKLRGRIEELRRLAVEIDRRMPLALKQSFMEDADAAVFEPEFYRHPIHFLLPVGVEAVGRKP
jgi:Fe-S-cluster containining protein